MVVGGGIQGVGTAQIVQPLHALGVLVPVDVIVENIFVSGVGVGARPGVKFGLAPLGGLVLALLGKVLRLWRRLPAQYLLVQIIGVPVGETVPVFLFFAKIAPGGGQVCAVLIQRPQRLLQLLGVVSVGVVLEERAVGVGPVLQHRKACVRIAAVPAEILAALILSLAAAVLPA